MDLETLYQQYCAGVTAIAPHLPRLRALARGLDGVIEFGVKRGASSTAWLLSARHVTSYDTVESLEARQLESIVDGRWTYRIQSSLEATAQFCDLLFIDSLHTFAQTDAELRRHADLVKCYLVFHDTITFGVVGASGNSGRQSWNHSQHVGQSVPTAHLGIRPAIDDLMVRDASWRIMEHSPLSHGLLVLKRGT